VGKRETTKMKVEVEELLFPRDTLPWELLGWERILDEPPKIFE